MVKSHLKKALPKDSLLELKQTEKSRVKLALNPDSFMKQ